jgi:hypothetical protein
VAADGRLRQLEDGTEVGDRELLALDEAEGPRAGGVRERGHPVEEGGGGSHQSVNPDGALHQAGPLRQEAFGFGTSITAFSANAVAAVIAAIRAIRREELRMR